MKLKVLLFNALLLAYFSLAEQDFRQKFKVLPAIDIRRVREVTASGQIKQTIKIIPGLTFYHPGKNTPPRRFDSPEDQVFKVMPGVTLQRKFDENHPDGALEGLTQENVEIVPRLIFYHASDRLDLESDDEFTDGQQKYRVLPGVSLYKKNEYENLSGDNVRIVPGMSFYRRNQEEEKVVGNDVMSQPNVEEVSNRFRRVGSISQAQNSEKIPRIPRRQVPTKRLIIRRRPSTYSSYVERSPNVQVKQSPSKALQFIIPLIDGKQKESNQRWYRQPVQQSYAYEEYQQYQDRNLQHDEVYNTNVVRIPRSRRSLIHPNPTSQPSVKNLYPEPRDYLSPTNKFDETSETARPKENEYPTKIVLRSISNPRSHSFDETSETGLQPEENAYPTKFILRSVRPPPTHRQPLGGNLHQTNSEPITESNPIENSDEVRETAPQSEENVYPTSLVLRPVRLSRSHRQPSVEDLYLTNPELIGKVNPIQNSDETREDVLQPERGVYPTNIILRPIRLSRSHRQPVDNLYQTYSDPTENLKPIKSSDEAREAALQPEEGVYPTKIIVRPIKFPRVIGYIPLKTYQTSQPSDLDGIIPDRAENPEQIENSNEANEPSKEDDRTDGYDAYSSNIQVSYPTAEPNRNGFLNMSNVIGIQHQAN